MKKNTLRLFMTSILLVFAVHLGANDVNPKYPKYKELLDDWSNLRKLMRKIEHKLRDEYKLQKID